MSDGMSDGARMVEYANKRELMNTVVCQFLDDPSDEKKKCAIDALMRCDYSDPETVLSELQNKQHDTWAHFLKTAFESSQERHTHELIERSPFKNSLVMTACHSGGTVFVRIDQAFIRRLLTHAGIRARGEQISKTALLVISLEDESGVQVIPVQELR